MGAAHFVLIHVCSLTSAPIPPPTRHDRHASHTLDWDRVKCLTVLLSAAYKKLLALSTAEGGPKFFSMSMDVTTVLLGEEPDVRWSVALFLLLHL